MEEKGKYNKLKSAGRHLSRFGSYGIRVIEGARGKTFELVSFITTTHEKGFIYHVQIALHFAKFLPDKNKTIHIDMEAPFRFEFTDQYEFPNGNFNEETIAYLLPTFRDFTTEMVWKFNNRRQNYPEVSDIFIQPLEDFHLVNALKLSSTVNPADN